MTERAETGRRGEAAAARHYLNLGYCLLAHNYRTRFGELDLVLEKDGRIVICEVKTRRAGAIARPAASVDTAKQRRLILAAKHYLQASHCLERPVRFDVAEVYQSGSGALEHIEYIKNAF